MSGRPAIERRAKPRQGASLPTLGLSLEELVLVLEIAPKGWSESEALGLVRRIAREVSERLGTGGDAAAPEAARWRALSTAEGPQIHQELRRVGGGEYDASGDAVLARVARLLKHDLAGLHRLMEFRRGR